MRLMSSSRAGSLPNFRRRLSPMLRPFQRVVRPHGNYSATSSYSSRMLSDVWDKCLRSDNSERLS